MIALTSFLQVQGVLKLQKSWSVTDINIWKIKLQISHYLFRSLSPSGGKNSFFNYCKRLVRPWTMLFEPISSDLQHQSWQVKLVILVSTAHRPNTAKTVGFSQNRVIQKFCLYSIFLYHQSEKMYGYSKESSMWSYLHRLKMQRKSELYRFQYCQSCFPKYCFHVQDNRPTNN